MVCTLPKTRQEAKDKNEVSYFTGEPCKNGHVDKRYTNTGICYSCKKCQAIRDYSNHKDRVCEVNYRSYEKNKEARLESSKEWASKNRKKSNQIKKDWKVRNKEKYSEYCSEYNRNKREDPVWRLSKNTSKAIWESLKSLKGGRHWEMLVDYTIEELIQHLESQFVGDMNWDNYGPLWEVDHVKPKSLCDSFEEMWKLSNLQPLLVAENRSKCNRFIG